MMNDQKRLYVDVHVLQTVPSSCINRDDTGSPKTAIYGGVTRARVSSQSWKRAMREMFRDINKDDNESMRTKKIVHLVSEEIQRFLPDLSKEDSEKEAKKLCDVAIKKPKKNNEKNKGKTEIPESKSDYFIFISRKQIESIVQCFIEDRNAYKNPEKLKSVFRSNPGIDIALFGRMVADDASLNIDAAAQVAHSISTHRIENEYDYFTAVDDIEPEDHAGAGHIGTVEYNSSTLYRYATVAVHELAKHVPGDTARVIDLFLRAFVLSMPTGKQNTFANRTLPDAVYVALREDQPVNLVGAFEKAIPANDLGYVERSAQQLCDHAQRVYTQFANAPASAFVAGEFFSKLADPLSFDGLLQKVHAYMETYDLSGNGQ
jgi:CRISPR system Cascade subunit CasC